MMNLVFTRETLLCLLIAAGSVVAVEDAKAGLVLNTGASVSLDFVQVNDPQSQVGPGVLNSNISLSNAGAFGSAFETLSVSLTNPNTGTIQFSEGWQVIQNTTNNVLYMLSVSGVVGGHTDFSHYTFGSAGPVVLTLTWSGMSTGPFISAVAPAVALIDGTLLTGGPPTPFSGSETVDLSAGVHDLEFSDFSVVSGFGSPDISSLLTENLAFSISGDIFGIPEPPSLAVFLATGLFLGIFRLTKQRAARREASSV
jgi:hypothetical protein